MSGQIQPLPGTGKGLLIHLCRLYRYPKERLGLVEFVVGRSWALSATHRLTQGDLAGYSAQCQIRIHPALATSFLATSVVANVTTNSDARSVGSLLQSLREEPVSTRASIAGWIHLAAVPHCPTPHRPLPESRSQSRALKSCACDSPPFTGLRSTGSYGLSGA